MNSAIADLRIATGYWYCASPYSLASNRDEAMRAVSIFVGNLWTAEVNAFSPIAHSHPIALAADLTGDDHETWMRRHRPMFEAAHGLIVAGMRGWKQSRGVTEEIQWARELRKPRFLVDVETLDWQALG